MANFNQAFTLVLKNEGGYSNDPLDAGGETYKGIARNKNRNWPGWAVVDAAKNKPNFPRALNANTDLQLEVESFYQQHYWNTIRGDEITNQDIAFSLFDFGVNAGVGTSSKLAQKVAGVKIDGKIGMESITAINQMNARHFLAAFTLAKIERYCKLCEQKTTNKKFFYGWVRRALNLT